jgi:hypothetical protein
MTNWYKIFWWLTMADSAKHTFDIFSNWFLAFSIISAIVYGVTFIISVDSVSTSDDKTSARTWRKYTSRTFWFCFTMMTVLWILWAITPSKKDALIIIAGGAVGNFVTRDSSARQIPSEVMLLLRTKIKEEIKETSLKETVTGEKAAAEDSLKSKSKEELIQMLKDKQTSNN